MFWGCFSGVFYRFLVCFNSLLRKFGQQTHAKTIEFTRKWVPLSEIWSFHFVFGIKRSESFSSSCFGSSDRALKLAQIKVRRTAVKYICIYFSAYNIFSKWVHHTLHINNFGQFRIFSLYTPMVDIYRQPLLKYSWINHIQIEVKKINTKDMRRPNKKTDYKISMISFL